MVSKNGDAQIWLREDSALPGGIGEIPGYPPLGANGIAYYEGSFYVVNTEKGLIVRVPLSDDGSAGEPVIVAEAGLYLIDGIALDVDDAIDVALIGEDRVVTVDPASGGVTVLARASSGVDGPASLAFGTGTASARRSTSPTPVLSPQPDPGILEDRDGVRGSPLP